MERIKELIDQLLPDPLITARIINGHEDDCARIVYGSGHPSGRCTCFASYIREKRDLIAAIEELREQAYEAGWVDGKEDAYYD